MNDEDKGAYITKDWQTILFLLVKEVPLIDTRRVDEKCVEFKFADPEQCVQLRQNLLLGNNTETTFGSVLLTIKRAREIIRRTDSLSWR